MCLLFLCVDVKTGLLCVTSLGSCGLLLHAMLCYVMYFMKICHDFVKLHTFGAILV